MKGHDIVVLKVGGTLLDTDGFVSHLAKRLCHWRERGARPIVVHGGGKKADAWLDRLGIPTRKWKGRRITDKETLDVLKMVYRGLLQTDLTAGLQSHGIPALGMCGSDGWVVARKRPPVADPDSAAPVDFGEVGDIETVDAAPIRAGADAGFVPVVACLACDITGNVLNVNGDLYAAAIAGAVGAGEIQFLTDVAGILADPERAETLIHEIRMPELKALQGKGAFKNGMLPKVDAIEKALACGVRRVRVMSGFATAGETSVGGPRCGTLITGGTPVRMRTKDSFDPVELLKAMIAIPSVSGEEEALADFLEEYLGESTAKVEREGDSIIATTGSEGPGFLLNAHTDTVPATDAWSRPPYEADESDGRIFGLGAVDCKGPLAAMLSAFLKYAGAGGRGRVVFTATPEEETGGKDLARIIDRMNNVKGAIIAEPTALRPCTAQKGLLRIDLAVPGKGAHASRPWTGENAIQHAAEVIETLREIRFEAEHPVLRGVTLTPTKMSGGDVTNRVPDACRIALDIRYPPGIDANEIVEALKRDLTVPVEVVSDRMKPRETPAGSRLHRALTRTFKGAEFGGMFGASNWVLLEGIPAAVLGPGDPRWSHAADECIPVEDLRRGADIYYRICEEFFRGE